MSDRRTLITAAAIADPVAGVIAPGALLLAGGRVVAAGEPASIGPVPDAVETVDLPRSIVLPALVNAHAHLDLTHLGPRPAVGSFIDWIRMVRGGRASEAGAIADSVQLGVERSLAGGTAIIGDIAGIGSTAPVHALRKSPLRGVSYLEHFGLADQQTETVARMGSMIAEVSGEEDGVRLGLQPHAPYSCGLEVYAAAAASGLPVATHLAETPAEEAFTRHGSGPFAEFLASLGLWDLDAPGQGLHPIDCLLPVLRQRPWLVAHVNYPAPRHLPLLAESGASVVYCPRASAYFGHPEAGRMPHAYREMLEAGVNVALGTDSIICLDTPDRISVLDEMRLLNRRDGVEPLTLLRMATVNGARALEIDPGLVTLQPGPLAGLITVEIDPADHTPPLAQALQRDDPIRWVAGPCEAEAQARSNPFPTVDAVRP